MTFKKEVLNKKKINIANIKVSEVRGDFCDHGMFGSIKHMFAVLPVTPNSERRRAELRATRCGQGRADLR